MEPLVTASVVLPQRIPYKIKYSYHIYYAAIYFTGLAAGIYDIKVIDSRV
jgi:hypothetical protein